jgi:predicted dehydrogenase
MAAREIRWGIIGLGRIAALFADALAGTPGARLGAVCSRRLDKAKRFAAAAGGGANAFSDVDTMLRAGGIDAVYVASPNTLHLPHALAAIAAGKAVLCEKPLAGTAAEARQMAEAAQAAGVFFMEAMWTRFLPAVVEARRLVGSGAIGDVRDVHADLSFRQPYRADSRFYNPVLGGGALLDLGVYGLSLAIHFAGRPTGWRGTGLIAPSGVEARAAVALSFAEATATLSCGFDTEGANEAMIIGSRGRIRLHRPMNGPSALTVTRSALVGTAGDGATDADPLPTGPSTGHLASLKAAVRPFNPARSRVVLKPYRGNGLGHQIDEVSRCLHAGLTESPVMPLADSVMALEVIDDLRRSLRGTGPISR